MHNVYNSIKTICGPRSCSITPLKVVDGLMVLKDQKKVLARWTEHFEALLNQYSPTDLHPGGAA